MRLELDSNLKKGVLEVLSRTRLDSALDEYTIQAIIYNQTGFRIEQNNKQVTIHYSSLNYLYQALLELTVNNDPVVERKMTVSKLGIMLDFARNAVMTIESIKQYLAQVALLGYNYAKLYVEDLMFIEGENLFGYMRGAFSEQNFHDIVAYAESIGLEIIPCIQTLAHLNQIFRYTEFHDINDTNDILLASEEKTYLLIEKMVAFARRTTKSTIINIGADEAEMIGFGRYYHKHGYTNRYDIIRKHLERVVEICSKYDFKPEMWSDMIFKFAHKTYYIHDDRSMDIAKQIVPKGVSLIYWDYYHQSEAQYTQMIKHHKSLVDNPSFAGGIWTWRGFMPLNKYTELTMFPAIEACKKEHIDNVFFTMWGDNGSECSKFAVLPSLVQMPLRFADEYDKNKVSKMLVVLSGYSYEEWMTLDALNETISVPEYKNFNPAKFLFYDDVLTSPLTGLIHKTVKEQYQGISKKLTELAKRDSSYAYLFETALRLSETLEHKATLSVELYEAYSNKDHAKLKDLVLRLEDTVKALERFYQVYNHQWHHENQSFGFDVQIIRLGGLKQRLLYVKERLSEYLSGKIVKIDELEVPKQTVSTKSAFYLANNFGKLVTPSIF